MVEILQLGISVLWQAATLELLYAVIFAVGCMAIISYATWLLVERLKSKDSPSRSYPQWLKHVFKGVMGL